MICYDIMITQLHPVYAPSAHLSVPADLDLLVVIPWVEDVLGAMEGKTLLVDPLHTENPS